MLIVLVFKPIKGNASLKKSQNQLLRTPLVEGCQILRTVSLKITYELGIVV